MDGAYSRLNPACQTELTRPCKQAFYTASLASGSVIGGITGGYIAHQLGWAGQFWIGTALTGLAFLATIFLVPETMFDRGPPGLPVERTLPRPSSYIPRIRNSAP